MIRFKIEPNTVKALEVFAGVKDIRKYLNGVHVKVIDPATLKLSATDGTILASHIVKLAKEDDWELTPGEEGILPRGLFKTIKVPKHLTVEIRMGATSYTVTTFDGMFRGECLEGRFPDVERAWPRRVDVRPAYYDPNMVARLGDAAELLGVSTRTAIIPNGKAPAVWRLREDFAGIIMPMRIEETDLTMPEWTGTAIQTTRERIKEALAAENANPDGARRDLWLDLLRAVDPEINVDEKELNDISARTEFILALRKSAEVAA